jgi:hypothetical protein
MAATALILTKLALATQLFVKNLYTEFHKNPTNGLVPDTRSRTDKLADGPRDVVSTKGNFAQFVLCRRAAQQMLRTHRSLEAYCATL